MPGWGDQVSGPIMHGLFFKMRGWTGSPRSQKTLRAYLSPFVLLWGDRWKMMVERRAPSRAVLCASSPGVSTAPEKPQASGQQGEGTEPTLKEAVQPR